MSTPPALWDAARVAAEPFPPTDAKLASVIEDRFVDAYASQIGHLQRAAQEEMAGVETDIVRLRNLAWAAQKSASEQARRTELARAELKEREQDSFSIRQALARGRQALQEEAAALDASRNSLLNTEQEHADATVWASEEIEEMKARCHDMVARRQSEVGTAADLKVRLATAHSEREAEIQAAQDQARRAEEAILATKTAKAGLEWRDSVAEQTLREAVQRLESDFARERADYIEQDRRGLARVQAVEQEKLKEQWGATVGRAVSRPQAAAGHSSSAAEASQNKWKASSTANMVSQRMGMLGSGQIVTAPQPPRR